MYELLSNHRSAVVRLGGTAVWPASVVLSCWNLGHPSSTSLARRQRHPEYHSHVIEKESGSHYEPIHENMAGKQEKGRSSHYEWLYENMAVKPTIVRSKNYDSCVEIKSVNKDGLLCGCVTRWGGTYLRISRSSTVLPPLTWLLLIGQPRQPIRFEDFPSKKICNRSIEGLSYGANFRLCCLGDGRAFRRAEWWTDWLEDSHGFQVTESMRYNCFSFTFQAEHLI